VVVMVAVVAGGGGGGVVRWCGGALVRCGRRGACGGHGVMHMLLHVALARVHQSTIPCTISPLRHTLSVCLSLSLCLFLALSALDLCLCSSSPAVLH